jgi:hypothetical protein
MFRIENYFIAMERKIHQILSRKQKEEFTFDILDSEFTKKNKLICLKEKQRQMKIGDIWQEILGNYEYFENLGVGHETGLDILSNTRKIAIELKNRTNTDNSSSKKSNLDKLARFKKQHPDYMCIYGNINSDTEEKTKQGLIKIIQHDGVEIHHYVGFELLKLILGENTEIIIEFIKKTIDDYIRENDNI